MCYMHDDHFVPHLGHACVVPLCTYIFIHDQNFNQIKDLEHN